MAEQVGVIWMYENDARNETPFLNITSQTLSGEGEQGLLSFLFHPNYANNGRFFVYYSYLNDSTSERFTRLSEFSGSVSPTDPATEIVLLQIFQPDKNKS